MLQYHNEIMVAAEVPVNRTIRNTIAKLNRNNVRELTAPKFVNGATGNRLVLGVASMREHMTDEGWQITHGLSLNGYKHCGYLLDENKTDVNELISKHNPETVVIQDVREWDYQSGDFRDKNAMFTNVDSMRARDDIFRLTILKDSHQRPGYHSDNCRMMGIHAWIVYYNEQIVKHLATYVRPQHLIRTTHSIDKNIVPAFSEQRDSGCLFSGAVSRAYPLRQSIIHHRHRLPIFVQPHPGYHRDGCVVPSFMSLLNKFKVSICTSSMYGYTLRKLIESTACGCRVITDLPWDEILPVVEENLIRINPTDNHRTIKRTINDAIGSYSYDKQRELAKRAIEHYDYRVVCAKLAEDIQTMKDNY